jgi:monoamine oxidase
MFCGSAMKVFLTYEEPFWEGHRGRPDVDLEGLGEISNLFPMKIGGDHGLVGLITASRASAMATNSPKEIERRVLKQLYDYFDQDARAFRCKHFMYKSWAGEKFSAGCYEAVAHPNCALSLLEHGPKVHAGRVSFACTELARDWCGFVDGALQSGARAANEAIEALRGTGHSPKKHASSS